MRSETDAEVSLRAVVNRCGATVVVSKTRDVVRRAIACTPHRISVALAADRHAVESESVVTAHLLVLQRQLFDAAERGQNRRIPSLLLHGRFTSFH